MYHIHEVDVVIIGGGAAGSMAAIYAHRTNPTLKVAVLDKSKIETSGAAGRGMDALNTMALPPYSHPEDVVEHLTKVTEGVLDQEVAYVFGLRCPQVVKDLEEIMQREKGRSISGRREWKLPTLLFASGPEAASTADGWGGNETRSGEGGERNWRPGFRPHTGNQNHFGRKPDHWSFGLQHPNGPLPLFQDRRPYA